MRLAVTGFVSQEGGSVASANALLLQQMLKQRHEIDFFSKPTFVDPRPIVGVQENFRYVAVVNQWGDQFRRNVGKVPVLRAVARRIDAMGYNRLLVNRIQQECRARCYDLILWLGDYAHGKIPGVPTVSFAQGPPGTDARSVLERRAEIRELAGPVQAWKWATLARLRLSRAGLPELGHSDHVIVGSQRSRQTLHRKYGIDPAHISALPYPIDLHLFQPAKTERETPSEGAALRVLWLGRIVPRKRLDLFLKGAEMAIQQGLDLQISIVGEVGFVRGYERMIAAFPFPERLRWTQRVARDGIPHLLASHDVLTQPSDEENFGSSVAEAQACGLPVIVGNTNGNADYLSFRDIHLSDDQPATFAAALRKLGARKTAGRWGTASESRALAEGKFALKVVADQIMELLRTVAGRSHASAVEP